jgi:hypothetical protein
LGAGASVATAAQADTAGRTQPAAPDCAPGWSVQMEVSGYHNLAGDFLSLRPAIFVAGKGEAALSRLTFQALPTR